MRRLVTRAATNAVPLLLKKQVKLLKPPERLHSSLIILLDYRPEYLINLKKNIIT